jgi:16S rRNA (uracil1498-N3)-methyltransferase
VRKHRVPIRGLGSGRIPLPEEAAHYVSHVLRLKTGARFTVFDPTEGTEAEAELLGANEAHVGVLRVVKPATGRIFWVHGLPKGDKPEQIVRDLTELGVYSICFAPTERSIPKLNIEKPKRWLKISEEAARQCGRTKSAEVRVERNLDDALLWATANTGRESARFLFHPEAEVRFDPSAAVGQVVFATGPEGGFSDAEIAMAETKYKFRVCALGDWVLRTETVPAAVLGAVLLR